MARCRRESWSQSRARLPPADVSRHKPQGVLFAGSGPALAPPGDTARPGDHRMAHTPGTYLHSLPTELRFPFVATLLPQELFEFPNQLLTARQRLWPTRLLFVLVRITLLKLSNVFCHLGIRR